MTIDDPFAEPGEAERTVIRPNPGGRQPAEAAPAPVAAPPVMPPPMPAMAQPVALPSLNNKNPLINAALPLLDLAVQIKSRKDHRGCGGGGKPN